jgi:drug/metabolite transporter (DMT)-like permease
MLVKSSHRQSIRDFSKSTWLQLLLLGLVFYTFTQGAQFIGLAFLPAATVTLLLNFSPIFVAIPSGIINKEATIFAQWMGILLSLAGAIIYFLPLSIPAKEVIGIMIIQVWRGKRGIT